MGHGWAGVFNASVIRAQFRDPGLVSPAQLAGDTIPLAPKYTALLGVLYQDNAWSGSLTTAHRYSTIILNHFQSL